MMQAKDYKCGKFTVYVDKEGRIAIYDGDRKEIGWQSVEEICGLASSLMRAACYSATNTTQSLASALNTLPEIQEQVRSTQEAVEEQVNRFVATADELANRS